MKSYLHQMLILALQNLIKLSECIAHNIIMQSISQGSIKLQAHHDKITNCIASTTKIGFLSDQIQFLNQLKANIQMLMTLAKPAGCLSVNIQKLQKRISLQKQELSEEVVYTRRHTGLIQLQDRCNFEQEIGAYYENAVEQLDNRLQLIQDKVQKREDQKRLKGILSNDPVLTFNKIENTKTIQQYLKIRENTKRQLKKRLNLAGKIKQIRKREESSIFVKLKRQNEPYCKYHFLKKHKQYYHSKSLDQMYQQRQVQFLQNWQNQNYRKKNQNLRKHGLDEGTKLPVTTLRRFERQIYEESVEKFKNENSKLQVLINKLKDSVQKRENREAFRTLELSQHLDIEQAKARQVFAYIKMESSFNNKLDACSFIWAMNSSQPEGKNKWKAKQQNWEEQRLNEKRESFQNKIRSKSGQKKINYSQKNTINMLGDAQKSNERTNTSFE